MRKLFIKKQHPSIQHTHTHTYTHINCYPSLPAKGAPIQADNNPVAAGRSIPDKSSEVGAVKRLLTSHFISQTFRWLFVLHCTPSARAAVTPVQGLYKACFPAPDDLTKALLLRMHLNCVFMHGWTNTSHRYCIWHYHNVVKLLFY